MDTALPAGCSWRRPTAGDAQAFFALVATYNTEVVGFADFTLDDARDQLTEPGFDPARDAWLVHDGAGRLVGFGGVRAEGPSDMVEIEVVTPADHLVVDWLFDQTMRRADEMARSAGFDRAKTGINVHRSDERLRAAAQQLGFEVATTFHRMRIDHDGVPPAPVLPAGIEVRSGPGDGALQREAHRVLMASFAEHFGWVQLGFDEWHERASASANDDWSQLKVLSVDGQAAAMLLGHNGFVEDEQCGYVRNVGVLKEFRGRGSAQLLLRQAFVDDAQRGRQGTLLHVDTKNLTPALDLYLGVGMRAVLAVDVWLRDP